MKRQHNRIELVTRPGLLTVRSEEEEEIEEVDTDRVLITTQNGLLSNEDLLRVRQIVADAIVTQQQSEEAENPIKVATPVIETGKLAIQPLPGPTQSDGREMWTSKESGDQLISIIRSG